ncbi:MAG: hypothetical protein HQM08_08985 [Candidatus Riflebacteria bacterium]|nr:hypothetical protein [Candidatus Riflebacteria bacterium]
MKTKLFFILSVFVLLAFICPPLFSENKTLATATAAFKNASEAIREAAKANKFIVLLITEKKNDSIASIKTIVEKTVQKNSDRAIWYELDRNNASEKEIIEKYDLSRAPTPMILSVAPNGAVTVGLMGEKITTEKLEGAFVSEGFQQLLKAMQDKKLALMCFQNSNLLSTDLAMKGVKDFTSDPYYAQNAVLIKIDPANPKEEKLLSSLKLESKMKEATTVLLAPPGVSLAVFNGETKKEKIEEALKSNASCGCQSGCCGSGCGK